MSANPKDKDETVGSSWKPTYHNKCIKNVELCLGTNHLVQLLIGAMQQIGCKFDPDRHLTCEPCKGYVRGGYDATTNQAVICENYSKWSSDVCATMVHELIHMYDHCRSNMDFSNIEHLACTEIRAANLSSCGFSTIARSGKEYHESHQDCVKQKALASVLTTQNITPEEANKVIDNVFTRCYKDVEPFGRVPNKMYNKVGEGRRIVSDNYHYGLYRREPFISGFSKESGNETAK